MSNQWDLTRIRQLAGINTPLTESVNDDNDDDDGLSPAERELANRADKDLKNKGINVKNVDPDKDMAALAHREDKAHNNAQGSAKKAEPKKEEHKQGESNKDEPKKDEPKKEEPATNNAKRRGKAPNPESYRQKAIAWISAHPSANGGEFKRWLKETNSPMSANYANTFFYAHKKKTRGELKESTTICYMLQHPAAPSFLLAENKAMNQYQWVDASSNIDPLVFESEQDALATAQYINEYKNQTSHLVKFDLTEED